MSDLYTEVLIKRKKTTADTLKKVLLIAATVLAVLVFLFTSAVIFALAAVALVAADILVIPSMNVEFEYQYVNGSLDIDKIISAKKRKNVYSMEMSDLELIAPMSSASLGSWKNRSDVSKYDFSSLEENAQTYAMIVKKDQKTEMVIFEPNDVILKDIKRIAPRAVQTI